MRLIFDTDIKADAQVLADGWTGHKDLKNEYLIMKQTLSEKGKNLKMMHTSRSVTSRIGSDGYIPGVKGILAAVYRRIFSSGITEGIIRRDSR